MVRNACTVQISLANRKWVLFSFIWLATFGLALCKYKLTFKGMVCREFNPEFISSVNCSLKPIRRYVTLMNYEAIIRKSLKHLNCKMTITEKIGTQYKRYILHLRENVCDLMAGRKFSPIFSLIMNQVRNYSCFNHPCPFDDKIYFRNLVIDVNQMPILITPGEYRAEFETFEGKTAIFQTDLYLLIT